MEFKRTQEQTDLMKGFTIIDGKPALEMNDGTAVKLELKLNIKKLMLINRDFNTDEFVKTNMSDKSMEYTLVQGLQAIYIAYRQANMNSYVSFDEFTDNWTFSNDIAQQVYFSLLYTPMRKQFTETFENTFKTVKK